MVGEPIAVVNGARSVAYPLAVHRSLHAQIAGALAQHMPDGFRQNLCSMIVPAEASLGRAITALL